MTRALIMSLLALVASSTLLAQSQSSTLKSDYSPNPMVKMHVTLPDGQTTDVSAPESGLAMVTLKDGTSIGIRPTILDSKPWSRVVLTFFKTATATSAGEELASIEARTGGPAVQAKMSPVLKIAVTSVTEPGPAPVSTTH